MNVGDVNWVEFPPRTLVHARRYNRTDRHRGLKRTVDVTKACFLCNQSLPTRSDTSCE
jgi:hypothetical protein